MSKKSGGSNTRMSTTVAMAGGVFVLRKLLAVIWTKVTGKTPPTDLTDPKVTLPEAIAWAVATGVILETARFAIARAAARRALPAAGTPEAD